MGTTAREVREPSIDRGDKLVIMPSLSCFFDLCSVFRETVTHAGFSTTIAEPDAGRVSRVVIDRVFVCAQLQVVHLASFNVDEM